MINYQIAEIAEEVKVYIQAMEKAPSLKATDLRDGYKLLCEHDNIVLAGKCVFRRHPDTDFGNIRTAYRNYPDSVSETSGHLAWLTN